jgi:hypothetical protein
MIAGETRPAELETPVPLSMKYNFAGTDYRTVRNSGIKHENDSGNPYILRPNRKSVVSFGFCLVQVSLCGYSLDCGRLIIAHALGGVGRIAVFDR